MLPKAKFTDFSQNWLSLHSYFLYKIAYTAYITCCLLLLSHLPVYKFSPYYYFTFSYVDYVICTHIFPKSTYIFLCNFCSPLADHSHLPLLV